jgi:hypothetical protein
MDNKIAAVRSAAVEVMGALYHQIGPKLLVIAISDEMKPALKALLEAEFAKVGHDPAAAAKATRAVNGEEGGAGTGVAIPRQDLSALVDRNILGELNLLEGKTSWMNRKAAMEALTAACERSGHYLEANKSTGEIVKALKVRISDTQANLKPLAVTAIGHIVASLELESANKVLKIIASGMMTGLADNKKSMRDATVAALHLAVTFNRQPQETALADTQMLSSLLPSICESLLNVVGRQELLAWLVQNADSLKSDCGDLTASLVLALQDKTAAVRALSEQLLTALMSRSLISKVQLDKATRDLPPATKRGLDKTIAALMACFGSSAVTAKKSVASAVASVVEQMEEDEEEEEVADEQQLQEEHEEQVEVVQATPVVRQQVSSFRHHPELVSHRPVESVSDAAPVKRSGLMAPRAGKSAALQSMTASSSNLHITASQSTASKPHVPEMSTATSIVSTATSIVSAEQEDEEEEEEEGDSRWFLKRTSKARRLENFSRLNWPQPPQSPGEHEYQQLKAVWERLLTSDLAYLVFPSNQFNAHSQEQFVPAINELRSQMDCPYFDQHVDLILRWCSYILCTLENVGGLLSLLGFISDIFSAIRRDRQGEGSELLHEAEIASLVPQLIEKSGSHHVPVAFQTAIGAASEIISPVKITKLLLNGLHSVNRSTRVHCIEEIQNIIEGAGVAAMGRSGMKEIASFLENPQCDQAGFGACLNLIFVVYKQQGGDYPKLCRMLGEMSQKIASRVEDGIKNKAKFAAGLAPQQVSPSPAPNRTHLGGPGVVSEDHARLLQRIENVMASTPIKPSASFVPLPVGSSSTAKTEKSIDGYPSAAFRSPVGKASRQSMIPIAVSYRSSLKLLY